MKRIYTLIILITVSTFTVFAQSGKKPATATIPTGPKWLYGYKSIKYNFTYEYSVTMRDSSVKVIKSKIYADSVKGKSYLIAVNKDLKSSDANREQRIYSDQTLSILRIQEDLKGQRAVTGIATDSCWLFQVIKGRINAYSNLSELLITHDEQLIAFQVGNGPITPLTPAALEPAVQIDPKAHKLLLKGKRYRAIEEYNDNIQRREGNKY